MKKPKDFAAILDRIHDSESWRDSYFESRWKADLEQYLSKAPEKKAGSNLFIPATFMQCEVIKARVSESLFANRPFIAPLPRQRGMAEKAKIVESFLDWQFNEKMKIKKLFAEDVLADAIIFGTVVVHTGWMKKTKETKAREQMDVPLQDGFGGFFLDADGAPVVMPVNQTVAKTEVVYDDPIVQKIDLFDFFVDRQATNIDDARFCGHREYLTKDEITAMEEQAGWSVNWEKLTPESDFSGGKEIRSAISGVETSGGADDFQTDSGKSLYKVHHYWEDARHVVVIGESECALDEENPYWHGCKPYDKCCYTPLSNEFYGLGVPYVLRGLQSELNTSRNMHVDYNAMALRRMWKMRKGCGLTPDDLRWRQGGVLQVEDMDDIMEIGVSQLPASAFTTEAIVKQDMKDVTGCHDIIMGLADSDETATTTMTKDNNASIRFKYFIEAVVDNLLVPIAKKCLSLDHQFMEETRIVRLLDDENTVRDFLSVNPDDIDADFDMIYVGSAVEPMANKELYKQKVLDAYNLAMGNPLVQQDPGSMLALLRELLKALELKDVDAVLPNLPQPQPQAGAPGQQMQAAPAQNPLQQMLAAGQMNGGM